MKNHSLNFLDLVNESLKEIGECDIYKVKNCLLYTSDAADD